MIIQKQFSGDTLTISDEEEKLLMVNGPVLYLETIKPATHHFDYIAIEESVLEDEEYLTEITLRQLGKPLPILSTKRFLIRELCLQDIPDLSLLFQENEGNPFFTPFFQTCEEGEVYLKDYIKYTYALGRKGIYGIFIEGQFAGLAGFTEKEEGLELSYGLLKKYQKRGIAYEATSLLVKELLDPIIIRVSKDNLPACRLAEKLAKENIVFYKY